MNIACTALTPVVHYYSIDTHLIGIEGFALSPLMPAYWAFAVKPATPTHHAAASSNHCLFTLRIAPPTDIPRWMKTQTKRVELEQERRKCTMSKGTKEELNLHLTAPNSTQKGDISLTHGADHRLRLECLPDREVAERCYHTATGHAIDQQPSTKQHLNICMYMKTKKRLHLPHVGNEYQMQWYEIDSITALADAHKLRKEWTAAGLTE